MFNLELTDDEVRIVQIALAEYIAHRGPTPEEYVSRRYSFEHYSAEWLREKVDRTNRNLAAAAAIRERTFQ